MSSMTTHMVEDPVLESPSAPEKNNQHQFYQHKAQQFNINTPQPTSKYINKSSLYTTDLKPYQFSQSFNRMPVQPIYKDIGSGLVDSCYGSTIKIDPKNGVQIGHQPATIGYDEQQHYTHSMQRKYSQVIRSTPMHNYNDIQLSNEFVKPSRASSFSSLNHIS